jgi:aldose 1-epimerase
VAETCTVSLAPNVAGAFRVSRTVVGGIDAVELRDLASGSRAVLATRGATLLDWQVADAGGPVALTDGYRSAAELAGQNGVRNGLLAPFPNRIADGRYRFDGREHDLLPGVPAGERLVYHGFLRELDLRVIDRRETATAAEILFSGAIDAGDFPGYPFALALTVRARLTARGIEFTITATNVGEVAAPYAAGWHPYFRLGDAPIDGLELTVPAAHCIVTDDRLLPVAGAAAFAPVAAGPMPDFRQPRRLGAAVLDGCYANATPDADGLIRSRLRDPASGRQLTIWQRGGLTHVFTGDTLARDPRCAIAIEPVEAMTDAFNRPEYARALRLAPGATRSFCCGADFDAGTESAPHPRNPFAAEAA